MRKHAPTYPLPEVQALVRRGDFRVTATAAAGAAEVGMDLDDITACVLGLKRADFYKTMPAERATRLWQDVYRPWWGGLQLYVKLQITQARLVVVISCKER